MQPQRTPKQFVGLLRQDADAHIRLDHPAHRIEARHMDAQAQHLEYGWGYAVFALTGGQWSLVRVEMTDAIAGGPRGVGIGSSEADIRRLCPGAVLKPGLAVTGGQIGSAREKIKNWINT